MPATSPLAVAAVVKVKPVLLIALAISPAVASLPVLAAGVSTLPALTVSGVV